MRASARRFPRRVQVRFWAEKHPENSFAGYSVNISATGIFIATIHPHRPGTQIVIEFQGESKPFEVPGTVAHAARVSPLLQSVRPSGMGVRFASWSLELQGLLPGDDLRPVDEENRRIYPMYFGTPQELLDAFDRDIKNGGLFIPSMQPAAIDQEVTIELNLPDQVQSVMTFAAMVVHRIDSGAGVGMGIAFLNPEEVKRQLNRVVDALREG